MSKQPFFIWFWLVFIFRENFKDVCFREISFSLTTEREDLQPGRRVDSVAAGPACSLVCFKVYRDTDGLGLGSIAPPKGFGTGLSTSVLTSVDPSRYSPPLTPHVSSPPSFMLSNCQSQSKASECGILLVSPFSLRSTAVKTCTFTHITHHPLKYYRLCF